MSSLAALGNLTGVLIAERWGLSVDARSLMLYTSTGFILVAVTVELLPIISRTGPSWLIFILFFSGGFFSIGLDRFTGLVAARTPDGETVGSSRKIYIGVAIDLFTVGMMIGASTAITLALVLLLTLSQVSASIPEGFATARTFKSKGMSRRMCFLLSLSLAIPLFIGVSFGYWFIRDWPGIVTSGFLAVTAGILLTVTIEEIIPESYREDEDRLIIVELVGGFTLITLLSLYLI